MKTRVFAFVIGILLFYQLPLMPEKSWCLALLPFCILFLFNKHSRLFIAFICGFIWAFFRADLVLINQLPHELEGQTLVVTGSVVDLPRRYSNKQQFTFKIKSIEAIDQKLIRPYLVKLSWYEKGSQLNPPIVSAGETWQFTIRLKRPNGFMNPGGRDYEASLFQQGINATGYIKQAHKLDMVTVSILQNIHRWRANIYDDLRSSVGHVNGIIPAMGLGIKDDINQTDWRILRKTGTIHLTAISGLHISFIAALAFFIGRWFWSLPVITLHWLPAVKAGAIFAILGAFVYAGLAGFSIPTQRALIMVTVIMLCLLSHREMSRFDIFSIALFSVLLFSPASVIAPGFWLSFSAVAIIFYTVSGRTKAPKLWRTSLKVHFILAIGLSPILLIFFGQNPLLGPVANIIAVPFFTLLITPMILLGIAFLSIFKPLGILLLSSSDYLIELFWPILEKIAALPFSSLSGNISSAIACLLSLFAVALFLMPKGLPGRWLGLLFIIPAVLIRTEPPAHGDYSLTLLDVGQGLSTVIRTKNHVLVYDTGAKFNDNFDLGKMVLLPYLHASDIDNLDTVIVSHGDNDHAGGYSSLAKELFIKQTLSSVPEQFADFNIEHCLAGQQWNWDGVSFEVLHPEANTSELSQNNRSCVLKVDNGYGSVLLTGDIEAKIESRLIAEHKDQLDIDILIAPHHGSKTSSTLAFISATSPEYVLISAGYRNRFHHPAKKIEKRYQTAGLKLLETSKEGAISFMIDKTISSPELYRQNHSHFWNRNHVE